MKPKQLVLLSLACIFLLSAGQLAFGDSYSKLKKDLKQSIIQGDTPRAMQAVQGLIELDSPTAIETVCQIGFTVDNYDLERFIIRELRKIPEDSEVIEKMAEMANKSRDHRVRVSLVFALGLRNEKSAWTAIAQALYDPAKPVVLAAIEVVVKRDSIGMVEYLIDALDYREKKGQSDGLIHKEIRSALDSLTHKDFDVAADWRSFWRAHKKGFVRKPRDPSKSSKTTVLKPPPQFFGLEVATNRVLFIMDVSGSMRKRDPLPEDQDSDGPPPESRERLRRVQAELIAVIEKLEPTTTFDILTFSHQVLAYQDKLVPATVRNKRQAIRYIQDFNPQGETHTDTALQVAFEYPEVDTMFLLSDGAPRRNNQLLDVEPILTFVKSKNRFRRIRLNTICFKQGGSSLRKFMAKLAAENKGIYKELK